MAGGAFCGCAECRAVILPESVEHVGSRAFAGCAKLRRAVLPQRVKQVGSEAFSGCDSLLVLEAPGLAPLSFDEERLRLAAALGFCGAEERYHGENWRLWALWAAEERAPLITAAIDDGLAEAAAYFTRHALLRAAEYRAALERAQRKNAMEIVALLLAYGNDKLSGEDIFAGYSLDG
ncbi:MAG: leucine-rich repeat domain-containing protein [Synergistaceae bacterium]|nr:leucine-rich repeat domain-containing protein [Synergistaceae bacterium]